MWNLKYEANESYLQIRKRLADIENCFVVAGVWEGVRVCRFGVSWSNLV